MTDENKLAVIWVICIVLVVAIMASCSAYEANITRKPLGGRLVEEAR